MYLEIGQMAVMFKDYDQKGSCLCFMSPSLWLDEQKPLWCFVPKKKKCNRDTEEKRMKNYSLKYLLNGRMCAFITFASFRHNLLFRHNLISPTVVHSHQFNRISAENDKVDGTIPMSDTGILRRTCQSNIAKSKEKVMIYHSLFRFLLLCLILQWVQMTYSLFYDSPTSAERFTYKVLKIHHTVLENKRAEGEEQRWWIIISSYF